jgi:dihydrodipicolinate synthase/N-acetylneuraminate lyase
MVQVFDRIRGNLSVQARPRRPSDAPIPLPTLDKKMSNNSVLAGVLPIIQTPFDDSLQIDWNVLQREVDWAFATGASGFGTGMVSEVRTLSQVERSLYAERLVEFTGGRGPVFMSVTADIQSDSIGLARDAARAGCSAVMAAPPLQESLTGKQLYAYFAGLADEVDMPIIVQDASGYLGNPIPHSVYLQLLDTYDAQKIVFKPEAPPNGPCISALRDATGGAARIFEGSGGIYLIDSMRRGVVGTMPGMELLDGIVGVWRAIQRGDNETAYRIHLPLCAIVALQMQSGLDGFLAVEKYLLKRRGLFKNELRRDPIKWRLDPETAAEVDRLFDLLQTAICG